MRHRLHYSGIQSERSTYQILSVSCGAARSDIQHRPFRGTFSRKPAETLADGIHRIPSVGTVPGKHHPAISVQQDNLRCSGTRIYSEIYPVLPGSEFRLPHTGCRYTGLPAVIMRLVPEDRRQPSGYRPCRPQH